MKNSLFKRAFATVAAVPLALSQCLTYTSYAVTNDSVQSKAENTDSSEKEAYTLKDNLLYIAPDQVESTWYSAFNAELVAIGNANPNGYVKKETISNAILNHAGNYKERAELLLKLLSDEDIKYVISPTGDITITGKIVNFDSTDLTDDMRRPLIDIMKELAEKYNVPQIADSDFSVVDFSGTYQIVIEGSDLANGHKFDVKAKYIANTPVNGKTEFAVGDAADFILAKVDEVKSVAYLTIDASGLSADEAKKAKADFDAKFTKYENWINKVKNNQDKINTFNRKVSSPNMKSLIETINNYIENNKYANKVEDKLNKDLTIPATVADIMNNSFVVPIYEAVIKQINQTSVHYDVQISKDDIASFADNDLYNLTATAAAGTYTLTGDFPDDEVADSVKHMVATFEVGDIYNADGNLATVGFRIYREPVTTTTTTSSTTTTSTTTTTVTSGTDSDTDTNTTTTTTSGTGSDTGTGTGTTTTSGTGSDTGTGTGTTTTSGTGSDTGTGTGTTTTSGTGSDTGTGTGTTTTSGTGSGTGTGTGTTTTSGTGSDTGTGTGTTTTSGTDSDTGTGTGTGTTTTSGTGSDTGTGTGTTTTSGTGSDTGTGTGTITTSGTGSDTGTDTGTTTTSGTGSDTGTGTGTTTTSGTGSDTGTGTGTTTTSGTGSDTGTDTGTTTTTSTGSGTGTIVLDGVVKSWSVSVETSSYGFYYSHDEEFNKDQVGDLVLHVVYETDKTEDIQIDYEFASTPAETFVKYDADFKYIANLNYAGRTIVDSNGTIVLTEGDALKTVDGSDAGVEVYIGYMGDVNLDYSINAVDASQTLGYYAETSTGKTPDEIILSISSSLVTDPDSIYDHFAAFLGDVKNDVSDNWKAKKADRVIDAVDASNILSAYAYLSTGDAEIGTAGLWDKVFSD